MELCDTAPIVLLNNPFNSEDFTGFGDNKLFRWYIQFSIFTTTRCYSR